MILKCRKKLVTIGLFCSSKNRTAPLAKDGHGRPFYTTLCSSILKGAAYLTDK
jgi:hypothetical protein